MKLLHGADDWFVDLGVWSSVGVERGVQGFDLFAELVK